MICMKVLLHVNNKKDPGLVHTKNIVEYLNEIGIEVLLSGGQIDSVNAYDSACGCDFVVSVGGDGTFLQAAKIAYEHDVPIVGVNLGRLGFMPSLEINELNKLKKILDGDFVVEQRAVLNVDICSADKIINCGICVNDAILKMSNARTLDLKLFCNGQFVNKYRADGIVISTPTGSSAYSLSCGGPIVSPAVECILATPICAHTFSSRPIVFDLGAEITLALCDDTEYDVYLSLDGAGDYKVSADEQVKIYSSDKKLKILRLDDMSYYELLSKKLDF